MPIAVIVLGIAVLSGVYGYLWYWSARPLPIAAETRFIVHPGPFSSVIKSLAAVGLVDSPWLFSLRARQRRLSAVLQSGEYRAVPGETTDELLSRLAGGDVVVHQFRIAEGSTVARTLARAASDDRLNFDLAGATVDNLMARLGLAGDHAEGRFFPDTYRFVRGRRVSALLIRAHQVMNRILTEAWAGRDRTVPYANLDEALIMASIVEKETALRLDQARVAGVFVRRLGRGMRLQSDPTVIYGLADAFDGNLSRAHLDADGPYNTYRNFGLPPTPIALPSRAAIDAALHPDAGKALYFVSRGDGTSEFSETLAEHNAAVRRYQMR